jgi:hypothetical protein
MSSILVDIEKGAVALVHDLAAPPTDPAAIPQHLAPSVLAFAERLGIDPEKLGGTEAGVLFDVLGHAVEAVQVAEQATGHAQAGAGAPSAAEGAGGAAEPTHVAETEVSVDNPAGVVGADGEPAGTDTTPAGEKAAPEAGANAEQQSAIDAAIAKAQSGAWQAGGGAAA